MIQAKAKIISNLRIQGNYWHCVLASRPISTKAMPGEFVNIKLSDNFEPLLRRPFSIHRAKSGRFEIIYEVLGKGSEILSQKIKGEQLDVIGPLGNGFNYRNSAAAILVAGGMGVAPLVFLSEKIKAKAKIALIGARTKAQVLCRKEFKNSGWDVKIATDDGSFGFKGKVTELLEQRVSRYQDIKVSNIYACGPKPMLKAVAGIAKKYKVPAQISLEEHMSCGIGACLGCVVKTKNGLERVCLEGPVFEARDIIWD